MMKKILLPAMVACFLFSCNSNSETNSSNAADSVNAASSGVGLDTMPGKNSVPIDPNKLADTGAAPVKSDTAGKMRPDNTRNGDVDTVKKSGQKK